jgi:hypothetical protein
MWRWKIGSGLSSSARGEEAGGCGIDGDVQGLRDAEGIFTASRAVTKPTHQALTPRHGFIKGLRVRNPRLPRGHRGADPQRAEGARAMPENACCAKAASRKYTGEVHTDPAGICFRG